MKIKEAIKNAGSTAYPVSAQVWFLNREGAEDVTEFDLYADGELQELWETLHEEMDADADAVMSISYAKLQEDRL